MFPYVTESFSAEEQEILRRYFTNLDRPVFALVNLPEVVKGALFARYSRSPKSLRRLFLDEFVRDLDISGDISIDATVGLKRAEDLYEKVFLEYGDDSVAQLGGVHLACEQASNLLTKVLERGRLMAYLEQSTRYINYDSRLSNGQFRYYRPPEILDSPLGAKYIGEMDRLFDTYAELLPKMQSWLTMTLPKKASDSDFVYRQAIRAKALDSLRGILPTGAISNVGVYGTGQSFEMLLMRMNVDPLPEARSYAEMMLEELRKVIPSFLQRVDRLDRGVEWSDYFAKTRADTSEVVKSLEIGLEQQEVSPRSDVTLVEFDPYGEDKVLAAIYYSHSHLEERRCLDLIKSLSQADKQRLLKSYVGERSNRRHKPGRAFERTEYSFDLITDYGAFRDLQRHRMLTLEWQKLDHRLGFEMPEIVGEAGLADEFMQAMERSSELYLALLQDFPAQAAYALSLAYRIRYSIRINAREAMHLIELRSGRQGHSAYRRVAQSMHDAIANQAGHRLLADSMSFVDYGSDDLERLESERSAELRRNRQEGSN